MLPDAPRSDPLPPVHPLSRFSDDPSNFRRRKTDQVPRLPKPTKQCQPILGENEQFVELPEGRYIIERTSDIPGHIKVKAKQLPWSATWVET